MADGQGTLRVFQGFVILACAGMVLLVPQGVVHATSLTGPQAQAAAGHLAARVASLEQQVSAARSAGDNAWMLVCCALVLMMTGPGLALFYGGLVRKKNVLGTMVQSFSLMAIVTVLWGVVGYSLCFAPGNAFIGGLKYVFLHGVGTAPNPAYAATIPQQTFMLFQLMFAIITPALITGAFADGAGLICDTFHFADLFDTLEMNPTESARLEQSLRAVLTGAVSLGAMIERRHRLGRSSRRKVNVPRQIRFDHESSPHSSILEIIAADQPGLLYEISSALSAAGCNIEVALIDTEGPKAIDVFYLTHSGGKLDAAREEIVRQALLRRLPI